MFQDRRDFWNFLAPSDGPWQPDRRAQDIDDFLSSWWRVEFPKISTDERKLMTKQLAETDPRELIRTTAHPERKKVYKAIIARWASN